jgi:hypothetical protein
MGLFSGGGPSVRLSVLVLGATLAVQLHARGASAAWQEHHVVYLQARRQ